MELNFTAEIRKQGRFEQIGTDNPCCPDCGETDWRCFFAPDMPRCAKCAIKARRNVRDEKSKLARFKKLGTTHPRCPMCGETDWRCFERHHISGQHYDPMTVPICVNDHLRVTDQQKDHPTMNKDADPYFANLNNFLCGLADMLRIIADKLVEFADALVARMSGEKGSVVP